MPYSFKPGVDGNPPIAAQTVTAGFDGTDSLTFGGNLGSEAVGKVLRIQRDPTGKALEHYWIIEVTTLGTTPTVRVFPTPPNNGGVVGSAVGRMYGQIPFQPLTPINFPAANQVQFSANVNPGKDSDEWGLLVLGGTPGTGPLAADGGYIIDSLVAPDTLQLKGSPGFTVGAAPAGSAAAIANAGLSLFVEDEAAADMNAAIAAAPTCPAVKTGFVLSDWIERITPTPVNVTPADRLGDVFLLRMFRLYLFTTAATNVLFTSKRECWVHRFVDAAHQFVGEKLDASVTATDVIVRVGEKTGNDNSARQGSLFFGFSPSMGSITEATPPDKIQCEIYGSAVMSDLDALLPVLTRGSEVLNTLWSVSRIFSPLDAGSTNGVPVRVRNLIDTGQTPFSVIASDVETAELFETAPQQALAFVANDARIDGLLLSDIVNQPLIILFGTQNYQIVDPKEDYPIVDLFQAGGTNEGVVRYTFDPRFIREAAELQAAPGTAIAGLTVRVWEIEIGPNTEVEITGSPFTTDAQGRIQVGGNPVLLRRSRFTAATPTEFNHRVVVEGAGFQQLNQIIRINAPVDQAVIVPFYQPDIEGEIPNR